MLNENTKIKIGSTIWKVVNRKNLFIQYPQSLPDIKMNAGYSKGTVCFRNIIPDDCVLVCIKSGITFMPKEEDDTNIEGNNTEEEATEK